MDQSGAASRRGALIALAVAALAGCARIHPPAHVGAPAVVGLVNYGRHTSLLLPDADDHVTEWAYGDWSYCARGKRGIHIELGAVLLPTSAALGRRKFDVTLDSPWLAYRLAEYQVHRLTVERAKVEALRGELNRRFEARADEALYAEDSDMTFVPAGEMYGAWSTCNNAIGKWLSALGCDVRGCTQTADFVIVEPGGR